MTKAFAPYLLPSGESLSSFLAQGRLAHDEKVCSGAGKRRTKRGFRSALERRYYTIGGGPEVGGIGTPRIPPEEGRASLAAFQQQAAVTEPTFRHLGFRRFRRWANDRLLRELAGPLTADDMSSLFTPIPFGQEHPPSAFSLASEPGTSEVMDLFLNINPDREAKVLQRWEEHLQRDQGRAAPGAAAPPAVAALRSWTRVSPRARQALRRASDLYVQELELGLIVLRGRGPGSEAVFAPGDSFGRLVLHGLCEYHGLRSRSFDEEGTGERRVAVAVPARAEREEEEEEWEIVDPSDAEPTSLSASSGPDSGSHLPQDSAQPGAAGKSGPNPRHILCSDILGLLADHGELTGKKGLSRIARQGDPRDLVSALSRSCP